jgi:hypothetical protein
MSVGCWFPSDRTRLLVNFLPRWLIIFIILAMYLHLYILIYKTQHDSACANSEFDISNEDGAQYSSSWTRSPGSASVSTTNTNTNGASGRNGQNSKRNSTNSSARRPSRTLKRIAYQMMTYPLVYMLIWTIPTAIRIYQATTSRPAPTPVATLDKVSSPKV